MDLTYPRAILFDMDDTIIGVEGGIDKCWRDICNKYSSKINGVTADDLLAAVNEARTWYWSDPVRHRRGRLCLNIARREVVSIALDRLGINGPGVAEEVADLYSDEINKRTGLLPGATETLRHLRKNRVMLALVTNGSSDVQRNKISRFDLGPLFDELIIEGELGFGKPDERIFLHALDRLNIAAAEAWMIGDDLERDIAGARRLGIFSLWVDSGIAGSSTPQGVQPDRIIKSVSELM